MKLLAPAPESRLTAPVSEARAARGIRWTALRGDPAGKGFIAVNFRFFRIDLKALQEGPPADRPARRRLPGRQAPCACVASSASTSPRSGMAAEVPGRVTWIAAAAAA